MTGRNKRPSRSICDAAGRELFLRLVETADVVIENYRPGTFARWGLCYDELAAVNPRSSCCTSPATARRSLRTAAGYGTVAEAFSGIPSFTGFPDKPPTLSSFAQADSMAGTFAAMAPVRLYERDSGGSGKGQEVDVSLYEPLFRLAESALIAYDQLRMVRDRAATGSTTDSPRNAYETRDGRYITISASTRRASTASSMRWACRSSRRRAIYGRVQAASQRRRSRRADGRLVSQARLQGGHANAG